MLSYTRLSVSFLFAALVVCLSGFWTEVQAQTQAAGIQIDANNVLRTQTYVEPSLQTLRMRQFEASQQIPQDLRAFTSARAVSLTRLERAIAEANGVVSDEVRYMAGLQGIDHVLVYPETGDVVLVGPAEGWYTDVSGRVVGLTTGKPVLRLEDMVAALRAFPPQSREAKLIGCSIDPTQEGLANLQNCLQRLGSSPNVQTIVPTLRNALGMQTVTVQGVSPSTHFAQVLVEADYRMKLMGIGLEPVPCRGMKSFVANANPASVSRNALFRWYFVPNYECIQMSPDKLAISLVGKGVKLVGADELVTSEGERKEVAASDRASRLWTQGFTKNYDKIAENAPVYAELHNLIDMTIVAAFLQETDVYGKLEWETVFFGNESRFRIETGSAPKFVESAVSAVWKGNTLMTPIGGGVEIYAQRALSEENLISADDATVAEKRFEIEKALPETAWWWN